jgi:hypothetical protein
VPLSPSPPEQDGHLRPVCPPRGFAGPRNQEFQGLIKIASSPPPRDGCPGARLPPCVLVGDRQRATVHFNPTDALRRCGQPSRSFPWETAPRYVLGDRDAVYGSCSQPTTSLEPPSTHRNAMGGSRETLRVASERD